MKNLILLFVAVVLVGCVGTDYSAIASGNRILLTKLNIGMSAEDVTKLMGEEPLSSDINQPYRTETSPLSNGTNALIWFYYSDIKTSDGAITDDELTPVVFEKGEVVGWGWTYLDSNYNRYKIKISR